MDYTVFGEVVEGLDVLDKILSMPTAAGDRPLQDISMKMEVIK
jgi:peptidyl-prolyl cis-trans isomerase B (cyclophilin B)